MQTSAVPWAELTVTRLDSRLKMVLVSVSGKLLVQLERDWPLVLAKGSVLWSAWA
jgi:hypothetical protein